MAVRPFFSFQSRWPGVRPTAPERGEVGSISAKEVLGRLKALREELSLRQEYLARRVGVDRTTYVRKELGAIPITTDEWIKLAKAMGTEPAYFFSSGAARGAQLLAEKEALLVRLYRALRPAERADLICAVHTRCRSIRRKAVRETLRLLADSPSSGF